jgi:hypothetical protein
MNESRVVAIPTHGMTKEIGIGLLLGACFAEGRRGAGRLFLFTRSASLPVLP